MTHRRARAQRARLADAAIASHPTEGTVLDPTPQPTTDAPAWRPALMQTRNIGTNRGRPRLWIEGAILDAACLTRGRLYTVEQTGSGFVLVASARGERRVSGKTKDGRDVPIVDIATPALLAPLVAAGGRVQLVAEPGRLTVTPAQVDA